MSVPQLLGRYPAHKAKSRVARAHEQVFGSSCAIPCSCIPVSETISFFPLDAGRTQTCEQEKKLRLKFDNHPR
jgi:hypothetical protein